MNYMLYIYIYIYIRRPLLAGCHQAARHCLPSVVHCSAVLCPAVSCQLSTGIGILLTMCLALGLATSILPSPGLGFSSRMGSHYGPFSDPFFRPFSNTLQETMLEPLDAILVPVACHFISILAAPGHKNEVRNASPSSRGQTP